MHAVNFAVKKTTTQVLLIWFISLASFKKTPEMTGESVPFSWWCLVLTICTFLIQVPCFILSEHGSIQFAKKKKKKEPIQRQQTTKNVEFSFQKNEKREKMNGPGCSKEPTTQLNVGNPWLPSLATHVTVTQGLVEVGTCCSCSARSAWCERKEKLRAFCGFVGPNRGEVGGGEGGVLVMSHGVSFPFISGAAPCANT